MTAAPAPARRSATWRALVIASVVVAAVTPIAAFRLLFPLTVNMPTWDQWSFVPVWEAYFTGHRVWPLLIVPYHGHLYIIPRVIYFLLGLLTSWNVRVEVVGAYAFAVSALAVLLAMLNEWDRRLLILAAPFAAMYFSFIQYENLLTGTGLGQHLANFSALLAIFFLTRPEPRWNRFLLAIACAAIATLSWGAGAAVWPVGLIAVATSPVPNRPRRTAIWASCAALGLFAARSAALTDVDPTIWKNVVPAFLVLSGGPFSWFVSPNVKAALALGIAACAALLALGAFFLVRPSLRGFLRTWGLVGLLGLTGAGLIAIARSEQPREVLLRSHYLTASFFSGFAIVALASRAMLDGIDRHRGGRRLAFGAGLTLICAIALAQPIIVSARWYPVLKSWSEIIESNSAKIMAGTATDDEILHSHFQDPQELRKSVEVLRRYRLAAFADGGQSSRRSALPTSRGASAVLNPLPDTAFKVEWGKAIVPRTMRPGERVLVSLEVRNASPVAWPDAKTAAYQPPGAGAVRLSYRWWAPGSAVPTAYGARADLPAPLPPGASAMLSILVTAPDKPGDYRLQLDLVDELVAWFEEKGAAPLVVPVSVRP